MYLLDEQKRYLNEHSLGKGMTIKLKLANFCNKSIFATKKTRLYSPEISRFAF